MKDFDDILQGSSDKPSIAMFGITHYKYEDCDLNRLVKCGKMKVRDDCAIAFAEMKKAAKKDKITLNIVSGYRSSHYQKTVFKYKFKDSAGNFLYPTPDMMQTRLKFSAPSGYSEHHTGLAIDINSTEDDFKDTPAYQWLLKNAYKFGFEISFPQNNSQGLGFEPWHWRFVGKNLENAKIFKSARGNDSRFN